MAVFQNTQIEILIVDDNSVNLLATEYMLSKTGYDIYKVNDGHECLEYIKSKKPDLILLDVNLSGIDGTAVCKIIRENPETRNIYIVLMSGLFTDSEYKSIGLETGADAYLARPFHKRELLATVSSLLRIKAAEDDFRNALEEKKKSEEILRKYQDQLEDLVTSRTRELEKAIEEHEKAKDSIQDQLIFQNALIDSIPYPFTYRDMNKNLVRYNKAFEKIFDVSMIMDDYYSIHKLRNHELKEVLNKMDDELLQSPATKEVELTITDRNGSIRDFILKKTSFLNMKGEIAGILAIATEISERKKL